MKKHLTLLVASDAFAWLLLFAATFTVLYAYASFNPWQIILTAQAIKPVFESLGVPYAEWFAIAAAYSLNGGPLADIGAFLRGYPVSRDFSYVAYMAWMLSQV